MRKVFEFCFLVMLYTSQSFFLSCEQPIITKSSKNEADSSRQIIKNISLNNQFIWTPTQLAIVFPKQLSGLKKTNIKLNFIENSATAVYGDNKYTISIIDDSQHHFTHIKVFNKKYRNTGNPEIIQTIRTVRDGYKTIATIDDTGITSISFVFKHRYLFTITGNNRQTPYRVWRFLELNKFHNLQ
jgi:hypothetical protein